MKMKSELKSQYFPRLLLESLRKWIDRREIFAIKGPRQSGKTTLIKMLQNWLVKEKKVRPENIIFLTFEDKEVLEKFFLDPKEYVRSFIGDKTNERFYFLIDEFQYLENGGQILKLLYDIFENIKFVITGSSSLELTGKTAKFLVGRVFSFYLWQLNFEEFVQIKSPQLYNIYKERSKLVKDFLWKKHSPVGVLKKDIFSKDFEKILNYLLTENGLNYGNLPKGLLKFHKYKTGERTPSEEHLAEGAMYAKTGNNVFIHFTVSPEHQALFEKHIEEIKVDYENRFEIKIHIKFSIQKPSTDTIAVDLHNQPFRNEDGTILFRPGGHGALIENLNDIDADIIFVKNIDNVVPDRLKAETVKYKKALGGLLKEKQTQIFNFTEKLQNDTSEETINIVKTFAENELYITLDNTFETKTNSEKARYLISKLNRPLRVCGMVKNEGEPGGGPFFVKKESGSVSLQIVESAQIDTENTEKAKIVKEATHFNPVDLVLAVKDFKGNKFDLKKYIDPKTGFISQKSKNGKELKALELPGLWNGAMANWNTLFVEVPISTFNPVKVINDLLRDTHQ